MSKIPNSEDAPNEVVKAIDPIAEMLSDTPSKNLQKDVIILDETDESGFKNSELVDQIVSPEDKGKPLPKIDGAVS